MTQFDHRRAAAQVDKAVQWNLKWTPSQSLFFSVFGLLFIIG